MTTRRFGIGGLLLVVLSACGSTVETGGTGGSGGNGGTGGVPICAAEAFPCCAPGETNNPCCSVCYPTSQVCGGIAGFNCPADEFCDFGNDQCGGDDGTGICTKRPTACDTVYQPACGCDGTVYGNACSAQAAGFDVSNLGGCKPPPSTFACGAGFCTLGAEYCEEILSDVGGYPSTYQCQPLPGSCGGTSLCACLSMIACGTCSETPDGGLLVVCGGG